MRYSAWTFVVAASASACLGRSGPSAGQADIPYEIHQEALAAIGLQPLRTSILPPGEREVRIWFDVALAAPGNMYRFRIRGNDVAGQMVYHWHAPPPNLDEGERPGEGAHDLMLYSLRGSCTGFRRRESWGACRAAFVREPEWRSVLDSLESAGLWELPEPSTLPGPGRLVLDGWGVRVELRSGGSYRTYGYSNPDAQPWPEAAQVVRLVRALGAIDSLIRDPDVVKIYRGVTPGRYESEFRRCGSGDVWQFDADAWDEARRAGTAPGVQAADTSVRLYVEVRAEPSPTWLAREWGSPYSRVLQVYDVLTVKPWTGAECGKEGPPRGLREPG